MITMEVIEQLWLAVVAQMPEHTPAHVVCLLRADFLADFGTGMASDPLHVTLTQVAPGQSNAAVSLKLHVIEIYVEMAHEYRHARDPRNISLRLDAPAMGDKPMAHVVAGKRKAAP
jgi:hypothetical protein